MHNSVMYSSQQGFCFSLHLYGFESLRLLSFTSLKSFLELHMQTFFYWSTTKKSV